MKHDKLNAALLLGVSATVLFCDVIRTEPWNDSRVPLSATPLQMQPWAPDGNEANYSAIPMRWDAAGISGSVSSSVAVPSDFTISAAEPRRKRRT